MANQLSDILDVEAEKDVKIITELEGLNRSKDYIFLALIAPYVGVKISPSKIRSASLGTSEEFGVETAIEEIQRKTDCKNLILLVNSPGGLVHSSYKIAKALRAHFNKIVVFVPHIAASGGTLISLAGNEIVMGMMSQLSPIDPTINGKSALSIKRGFSNLLSMFQSLSEADAPYPLKVLARKYVADELDQAITNLKLMEIYAAEILEFSNKKQANEISKKLVNEFLTHSQVIDIQRAKELGLNVFENHKYKDEWKVLRAWLANYLLKSADKHIIRYFVPNNMLRGGIITNGGNA